MTIITTFCNLYSFDIRELDHAMLRRLEKRILVDLPTTEARKAMFEFHLPPVINEDCAVQIKTDVDYDKLASVSILYIVIFLRFANFQLIACFKFTYFGFLP